MSAEEQNEEPPPSFPTPHLAPETVYRIGKNGDIDVRQLSGSRILPDNKILHYMSRLWAELQDRNKICGVSGWSKVLTVLPSGDFG